MLGGFFGSSRDVMDKRSAVLSCMATFHSDRFLAYAFLAGGYSTPGPLDLDAINAFTMQILGSNAIGYWKFFNQSDAGPIIDSHVCFVPSCLLEALL